MTKTVEWKTHQSSCIVMPRRQTTQIYIYMVQLNIFAAYILRLSLCVSVPLGTQPYGQSVTL